WPQAVPYLLRAADSARGAYANQEALHLYGRVLAVAAADDQEARFAALAGRVEIWHLLGDRASQATDVTHLQQLARVSGPRQQARAALLAVRYYEVTADFAAQEAATGAALQTALLAGDPGLIVEAYQAQAGLYWQEDRYTEAVRTAWRGLRLAQAQGLRSHEAAFLSMLGLIATRQSRQQQAARFFEKSRHLHNALGNAAQLVRVNRSLASILHEEGDYPAAAALYEQALAFFRRIGDGRGVAGTLMDLGTIALTLGDYAAAADSFTEARNLFAAQNDPIHEIVCLLYLADTIREGGDPNAAEPFVAAAEARLHNWDSSHMLRIEQYVTSCRAHISAAQGKLERAAHEFAHAIALAAAIPLPGLAAAVLAGQAQVAIARGDRTLAHSAVYACLESIAASAGNQPLIVYHTCYMVLQALGDSEQAAAICRAAAGRLAHAAAQISDPARRQAFLTRVTVNRDIAAAATRGCS
ncbi:MAG TPA: tetratricopeptide repeat protein, partial [Chloroflexia bacterium]|nr:tetratricopeptide repeat protein [Chloroflexia bacterium]